MLEYPETEKAKIFHFTVGAPCFNDFNQGKEANLWQNLFGKSQIGFDYLDTNKQTVNESNNYEKNVTGITGGICISGKAIIRKDYQVFGLLPRRSKQDFYNLNYLNVKDKIEYLVGDVTDNNCMHELYPKQNLMKFITLLHKVLLK